MFELFAAVVLILLLALAGALGFRLRAVGEEARALRAELSALRQSQRAPAQAAPAPSERPAASQVSAVSDPKDRPRFAHRDRAGAPPRPPNTRTQSPAHLPPLGSARRDTATKAAPSHGTQAQLPLAPDPDGGLPPVPLDVLITALQFPQTADDTEGFRALRRALRDHRAGQLVQAAQDVLTLLSQEGLYMDDLIPDRARPELWRRFAQGERGGAVAELGGIRDRSALAMAGTRMREDPVFRDATHHFLRRFDRVLAHFEPQASDAQIVGLSDTRTSRAFMLLGRVMGIFD